MEDNLNGSHDENADVGRCHFLALLKTYHVQIMMKESISGS
jgi:hypothetical protein